MEQTFSTEELKALKDLQKGEINGYHIYMCLSNRIKDEHNKTVLKAIAIEERNHYDIFKSFTNEDIKYNRFLVFLFTTIARLFGLTFGVKLLERGEKKDIIRLNLLKDTIPGIDRVIKDEEKHEASLINMLNEEGLSYMSSVVLGLNDALVELTGALAGFTLSIQHSRTIALLGLITGISASLSMAASEYLATKTEEEESNEEKSKAFKASLYTGSAYIVTVILLIIPFLLFTSYILALGISIAVAIIIIAVFNYYISVAKDYSFKKRFFGMASVSVAVATISFLIGYLVKTFIGVDL